MTDLSFSPQSFPPRLAVSALCPHEALLYDLTTATNTVLGSASAEHRAEWTPAAAHGATVCSVRFTAAGSCLLSASYDRTVRVWSATDATLQHVLGVPVAPPPPPDDADPHAGGEESGEESGGEWWWWW